MTLSRLELSTVSLELEHSYLPEPRQFQPDLNNAVVRTMLFKNKTVQDYFLVEMFFNGDGSHEYKLEKGYLYERTITETEGSDLPELITYGDWQISAFGLFPRILEVLTNGFCTATEIKILEAYLKTGEGFSVLSNLCLGELKFKKVPEPAVNYPFNSRPSEPKNTDPFRLAVDPSFNYKGKINPPKYFKDWLKDSRQRGIWLD